MHNDPKRIIYASSDFSVVTRKSKSRWPSWSKAPVLGIGSKGHGFENPILDMFFFVVRFPNDWGCLIVNILKVSYHM